MEKALYTQEDLLQALQKLIHERQRVKALESEVKLLKKGGSEFIPQSISEKEQEPHAVHFETELIEKNKEVELLKCAIKELGEKLKEAKKALSEQPKSCRRTPDTAEISRLARMLGMFRWMTLSCRSFRQPETTSKP